MLRSALLSLASLSLVAQTGTTPKAMPATQVQPTVTAKPAAKPATTPAVTAGVSTNAPTMPAPGSKAPEDTVIAKVGDEIIHESDIEMGLNGITPQQRQEMASSPEARQRFVKSFVEFRLLVAKSKKLGLQKTDSFKHKLAFAGDQLLATELMSRDGDSLKKQMEMSEADEKAYYEAHKDKFQSTADTYSARHILVKVKNGEQDKDGISDADAKVRLAKIQGELKAGKKLADLAKEYSDDPGSKDNGGLYENFDPGGMVPEFGNAVKTQAIGVVGEPVKTQFGYHLVEVTAKNAKGAQKPFESVKKEIDQMGASERQEKVWNEYLGQIKKEIPFEFYGDGKIAKSEATAKPAAKPATKPAEKPAAETPKTSVKPVKKNA